MRSKYSDRTRFGPFFRRRRTEKQRRSLSTRQQRLVEKYLPMARAWASPFKAKWPGAPDEFESAAALALVEAAMTFEPKRGTSFAGYAHMRVRGALLDVQSDLRHVRQLDGTPDRRLYELEYDATEGRMIMLSTMDPEVGHQLESADFVQNCLKHLPPKHAYICRQIYINGKTQRDAAKDMGWSKSKMSVVHREALDLLREVCGTRAAAAIESRRTSQFD